MLLCGSNGSQSPTYILSKDTHPAIARWVYHTQLANMSFDEEFDLTAGVYVKFSYY